MTNEEFEELKENLVETICDDYCKMPERVSDDVLLEVVCNKCPVQELLRLTEGVDE